MFEISYSNQFKKDLRLAKKRGYDINLFLIVLSQLQMIGQVEPQYRPHRLQGAFNNYMECHIKSDWLLIWKQDDNRKIIILTRTGTHTDLF